MPFLFNTIGVDDGIAMGHAGMKYSLPSRELIADCVETMIEAHQFDGDDLHPQLRQDRARHVDGRDAGATSRRSSSRGGPMEAGKTAGGKTVDLIDAFVAGVQQASAARSRAEELDEIEQTACPTCGSLLGHVHRQQHELPGEALGMALPGNGTILATSADRKALYERAAERIVEMAREFGRGRRGARPAAARDRHAERPSTTP